MPRHNRPYTSSVDPCGYEPLLVDEDCLSDSDCREAISSAVDRPRDGLSYLTREEQKALAKDLDEIKRRIPPHVFYQGEYAALTYKRAEYARLGTFRACARDQYADGRRIWYGDHPPWLPNSGGTKPRLLEGAATDRSESTS